MADALPVPLSPAQLRLNCAVLVIEADVSLPDVGFVPDQPPDAVHVVAFVEDQVNVVVPPLETEVGLAVRDTLGAAGETATVSVAVWVPPIPVQERL